MALVHERLYQGKDLSKIDLTAYINDLLIRLMRGYKIGSKKVTTKTDMESISVSIDSAIPCGLIINELVTNSLKYAFPEERTGEIRISLKYRDNEEVELVISDDGIGMPHDFDFDNAATLGLQMVKGLAEEQLSGEINLSIDRGTEFKMVFKDPSSKVRV